MCTNCKKPYYISTAIAYTSGKPHIGNTYEIVLADAIARYKREQGYDVYFQTGTDEHGQKIELKAADAGVTPKEFVDNVAGQIKEIWDLMNTSYDKFIRTTDDYHEKQVQKIFKKLYDQGDIYKGHYEGLYCTPCESFWTPSQVVDGKCPDCGRPVQPAKEEAYFFRMSKYAQRLIDYINEHPEFIQPVSRKNEMMNNFLLPGLQDLCVSRTSFKWGIPVDFDPKHVVYVWLDALTNYITGLGYDCDGESGELFLNVKTLKQRGVFRLFKKDVVEVTAALEEKEFINGINNKKPTMENKGANSGFISSQPMKNITGGSQINLVADEKIDMNSNAANIEKKLDSLHSLLENQMNPGSNSAKRPAAASVMHEETYAQDTGKKIVKERENANYKFLQLIYKKLVDNEVDKSSFGRDS